MGLTLSLAQCSALKSRQNPPLIEEARALKGESLDFVVKKFGPPADIQNGQRRFWFLTRDSKYHPEARSELYEFIFKEGQLVEISGPKETE